MFGAQYFGQTSFASTPSDAQNPPTGGGGWSHRGPVQLPKRKIPKFEPMPFKKLPPPRW